MKVISITGGVGSGKSEVLRILQEEFGADIIIADKVAHQLMEPGKKGYGRVVAAFGTSLLSADGSIDRQRMAELIFSDKDSIEKMNSIIHPMVWSEIEYAIAHSDKIWWQWRRLFLTRNTTLCLMKSGISLQAGKTGLKG